jgi:glycosyltransferase involved in cell wall biosynthesis
MTDQPRKPRGPLLWLAGTGEQAYVDELKRLAGELGVADRAKFLGLRSNIPALLAEATVVAHPAVVDALPRSLVEAAAAARPIVATRVGGIPEVVRDGQTGYLCGLGNVEVFAHALSRLLADAELAAGMGRAGRQWVSERFSYDRMCDEYVGLYRELLDSKGA